jgi:ribose transport system ATP-binding protein
MDRLLLEMRGIRKSFGAQAALKGVSFALRPGEIHGLIGENGAGKTTLMNVLGGVVQPDAGEIRVDGRAERIESPAASKRLGIGFIHQELNLVNDLTVYENMFLGAELLTRLGLMDERRMAARSAEILSLLDVHVDPRTVVGRLDASYKQVVEIGRALLHDAKILIMDEPTTSLTDHEIELLFKVMRSVSQRGVATVFISHKLREITSICHTFTVLRDGELMSSGRMSDPGVNEQLLANLMVGKDVAALQFYEARPLGEPLLEVEGLSRPGEFSDVTFTLRRGEILGFTGLLGDGRTELFQCIFGDRPRYQGRIRVGGVERRMASPTRAQGAGLGYAPRNRKENAIVKDFSVRENITLATLRRFVRGLFVDAGRERERSQAHVQKLRIKAKDPSDPITSLSGGNQQKVVLAKWLEAGSDVLILDNPTQGIDIGAKADIYRLIQELARSGKAVAVLSSELPELLKVCDRIVIMFHGRIVGCLDRSEADEQRLMQFATGAVTGAAASTTTPAAGHA